jgi:dTMP kinase
MRKKRGYLITFEGIDGCGKTTQLLLAQKYLIGRGFKVLVLREPGSTKLAEKVRKILLDKKNRINPISELYLYLAARADLVREIIIPAVNSGKIVLCDRFYDSTTAYQGFGRGIDLETIGRLNKLAADGVYPDKTFLIDIDYKTSLNRRKIKSDRLESEPRAFFNRVRRGFLKIAEWEPKRFAVLDGRRSAEEIFEEIVGYLRCLRN